MRGYKKIEEYGVIGNLETCALVNNEGTVEWCCFPHHESPSVFASILDVEKGGYFSVRPDQAYTSVQQYLDNSNVLETTFVTASGESSLVDFMPVKTGKESANCYRSIIRKVYCKSGRVMLKVEFSPKFNYARADTELEAIEKGVKAIAENFENLTLYAPSDLQIEGNVAYANYTLEQGQNLWFILNYGSDPRLLRQNCEEVLENTLNYWRQWTHQCEDFEECILSGANHKVAARSGLILKMLMNQEEGSIAAASTTSIPEDIGGVRNWDYRYNWVRDSSFAIQAFYHLGHVEEAKRHLHWFTQVCKQHTDPVDIQPLYGMFGETNLPEEELYSLRGYRESRPVRIGNLAYKQQQLDVYGELVNAFYETTRYGEELSDDDWQFVKKIIDHVADIWKTKDAGIWEMRGEPKHHVYSKVMCWVAIDRGIKISKLKGLKVPLKYWEKSKQEIAKSILQEGFNKRLNSFVQSYGSEDLDACGLLIPMMGFLPFNDSRVQGTINAIMEGLTSKNGLVYRHKAEDGVHGEEGTFILCSFWLVKVLALSGRIEEAEKVLSNLMRFVSPTGLLSEEVDGKTGELLGNFPQAFSHIGLINSIIYLNKAKGRKHKGPNPLGTKEPTEENKV
jgi:GH15 family glucan-1,4-alpha-glucosidase